jgi:hypothetical protein
MAFAQSLDKESLKKFNEVCKQTFSEQAQFFLNAFWDECKDFAEHIYTVAFDKVKYVDMHSRGINYIHLYEEGNDFDFDMGLYYYECMKKFHEETQEGQKWARDQPESVPEFMTAIKRKKELRDTVDVNFDGRVSFMEILLYQYNCSPKTLMDRSANTDESEAMRLARAALDEVNKRIRLYEAEKHRLNEEAKSNNIIVRNRAKNMLAQILSGPLAEQLRYALIKAEAALRKAKKEAGCSGEGKGQPRTEGASWWLTRDLRAKKEKYGRA